MARLEPRRPAYWPWLVAAAAGAAAVVALVTVRPWQSGVPPATAPPSATAASVPEATTLSPTPMGTLETKRRATVAERVVFTPPQLALPPLDPIEPITRESIQPTMLSIPQLTVEPIVMPAVDDDGSIRERR
jgi:hypothetical protein